MKKSRNSLILLVTSIFSLAMVSCGAKEEATSLVVKTEQQVQEVKEQQVNKLQVKEKQLEKQAKVKTKQVKKQVKKHVEEKEVKKHVKEKEVKKQEDRKNFDYVRAVRSRTRYFLQDIHPDVDLAYAQLNPNRLQHNVPVNVAGYRLKTIAKSEFELQPSSDPLAGQLLKLKVPTRKAYQFDSFNKFILTMNDGSLKVYDSDHYDINNYDKSSSNLALVHSENPRSINNKQFKVDLDNAKKISFAVRPGIFWSDSSGKKTKYRLVARDFLAYILYNRFLSKKNTRFSLGGSEELDEYWRNKTSASRYNDNALEPETYLYELYGIDYKSFLDWGLKGKNKPIETFIVEGQPTEVLSIYKDPKSEFKEGLRYFLNFNKINVVYGFFAYPTEYNKELAAKSKEKNLGKGLVRELRYYAYGVDRETTLFAGRFIPVGLETIGGKQTFTYRKNQNFWDRAWVEDKNNIRKFVFEYYQPDDYESVTYTNFVQGNSLSASPYFLGKFNSERILKGEDPYINKDQIEWIFSDYSAPKLSTPRVSLIHYAPAPSVDKDGKIDTSIYNFNDNFARFMYGSDLETLARGEARPFMNFFGEDQISFRSLILAGVNWLQYADKAVGEKGKPLISYSSADLFANLEGNDAETSKFKTTFDGYEQANSIFAVVEDKRAIEISFQDNLEGMKELKESDSFKGGGKEVYSKLQDAMTSLLDRVYEKFNWESSRKIAVEIIPLHLNPSDRIALSQENMIKTINALDKRGRLAFTNRFIKEVGLLVNTRYNIGGYHSRVFGWSYDWEGNASFLQGALTQNIHFIIPYITEVLAKRREKDPNNPFPLLTRLGKLLVKGVAEGKYKLKSFKHLLNITNAEWKRIEDNNKDPLIVDPEDPDVALTFARFFLNSQKNFSTEEMIEINKEIAVLDAFVKAEPLDIPSDPNTGTWLVRQYGFHFIDYIDSTFDPLPDKQQIFD